MNFDYSLLAKYIIDDITKEDLSQIEEWCNLSKENKDIFSFVVKLRISKKYTKFNTSDNIEKALNEITNLIDSKKRISIFRRALRYAAMIAILAILSYGGYFLMQKESYTKIIVDANMSLKKVELSDGTFIWMKGPSELRIPKSFSKENLRVEINGDAFFDVTKSVYPFYVSASYINIGVYGTEFEVAVDNNNKSVSTTLINGKIALLDKDWDKVLAIEPGEKVTYFKDNNEYISQNVDINLCATWRFDQIVLENVTLSEIALKIESIYNVKVHVSLTNKTLSKRYRYVLNKNDQLENIILQLKYLSPLDCRIEGNNIYINELLN